MNDVATIGSLFSGVAGLDLGIECGLLHEGFDPCVLYQVEIDPFCRRVLEAHWPNTARHNDVREVGAHNLPRVDVLVAGFPCIGISFAGAGRGLAAAQSGLWHEAARIIEETRRLWHEAARIIEETRPSIVVIENVTALRRRGLDVVLARLDALGFDAEWHCVPASAVGAPHGRDRIFVVAHANGGRREVERVADEGEERIEAGHHADGLHRAGVTHESVRECASRWGHPPPAIRRVDDASAAGVDRRERHGRTPAKPFDDRARLRALGNSVVPAVARIFGIRAGQLLRELRARGAA